MSTNFPLTTNWQLSRTTRLARHNRIIWVEPREATWPHLWRRWRAGEWREPTFWKVGVSQCTTWCA